MQLSQLLHFVSTVKYGSMNLAAEKLFISQSAISQSIRKLEKEYNISLFHRSAGGKMRLNKNGEKMLLYAERILQLERELKQSFSEPMTTTTIRLSSGGGRLFPALLSKYAAEHPNIKFHTFVNTRSENIKALIEGSVDVIIDCGYIDEPENMKELDVRHYITDHAVIEAFCKKHNLKSILFYKAKLYLCVPKDSPYANYDCITIDQLKHIPIIRSNYMLDYENWVTAIERYHHTKFNTIITADSDTYNQMIFEHGYNTLIMSSFVLNDKRFTSQRKLIAIDDPIAERDFYLYYPKGNAQINDFVINALNHFDWTFMIQESTDSAN